MSKNQLFAHLEIHFSEARLRQYLEHAGRDEDKALELYSWNSKLAASFFIDLGHLEVALRNAIDTRMTLRHNALKRPQSWLDDPTGELGRDLHSSGRPHHKQPYKDIAIARNRVRSNRKDLTHGQILSETLFGLWHQLVSKRWTSKLWPDLARAFPHSPDRRRETVSVPVADLRDLRNRIGHHHRIWLQPCAKRHQQLLDLAGYIDPELRAWIRESSAVPGLLNGSPLA